MRSVMLLLASDLVTGKAQIQSGLWGGGGGRGIMTHFSRPPPAPKVAQVPKKLMSGGGGGGGWTPTLFFPEGTRDDLWSF